MEPFKMPVQLRWSDFDPNFHLRHSVYYDWGAMCRIHFFYQNGLTAGVLKDLHIGPIILREECVFKKEIKPGDKVEINMVLAKARNDYSRWTIRHIILMENNVHSAILTIDGTWLDTTIRKMVIPPPAAVNMLKAMPLSDDFCWRD